MVHITRRAAFLVAALLAGMIVAVVAQQPTTADAAEVSHPSLAPESPRRNTPIALNGIVWKSVQLQDRVIVVGDFTQVETVRGGPIIDQPYIFAYDINTGALIEDFAPVVDAEILDVVAAEDDNGVYIGGAFLQVDGEWRVRVAKLGYDGSLDPAFRPVTDARVLALDVHDDIVYLGGSFSNVNNAPHDRIGAVDAQTGDTVTSFDLHVSGDLGKADTRSVKALDVHPDGDRLLVVFNGVRLVDGVAPGPDHHGIAMVDLADHTVSAWRTDWFRLAYPRCSQGALQLRDGEFSPDGSMFVVVEKGNWACDKTVAFTTADDGTNDPKWVTAMHDSTFSVGITNKAVYVGGHFCFVTPHGPIDADDAPTYPWTPKPEACVSTGNADQGEFIARYQLAALDLETGAPLAWNPSPNAQEAVFDIEPIDRGLLIGQDRDRVNGIRTGLHAFLDFGGTTPPYQPPPPAITCTASVDADGVITVSWNDLDGVDSWTVRRNDGWAATTTSLSYSESPGTGDFSYLLRYRQNGVRTDLPCSPDPVTVTAPTPACSATLVDGDIVVEWVDQPGVDSWQVRRNGGWYASTGDVTFTDADVPTGTYDYVIRYRTGGERVDLPCNPTITVTGPTLGCTATTNGADVLIEWNALPGVSSYQVRRDGGWLATSTGTSYTDAGAAPAAADYGIRYRSGGATVTIPCA